MDRESGNISGAARAVGVDRNTAFGWARKAGNARLYADGRRIDYETGVTTIVAPVSAASLAAVEADLHPRFLTVVEREAIADLRGQNASLRAIGRVLGRPPSTIKRR